MDEFKETIKTLSKISGVSGREENVADFIIKKLPKNVTYKKDAIGNLYVHKEGKKKPEKRLAIFSHMDEVGLIITYITEDGYLKFNTIGGIDTGVLLGRKVFLESGIPGIIGVKPVHMLKSEERKSFPNVSELIIDIGADSKKEAEKYVSLGDYACFESKWTEFSKDSVKMKALDDRAGCGISLELLKEDFQYDIDFIFTVEEEVGSRGASVAAFNINPDIAIILETTTAGDICDVENEKKACELGKGPVISYMDRGTVYDFSLYKKARLISENNGINSQTKTLIAGGNDSSSVQRAGSGTRVIAISVPTRYLHSESSVVKWSDVLDTLNLTRELIKNFQEGEI